MGRSQAKVILRDTNFRPPLEWIFGAQTDSRLDVSFFSLQYVKVWNKGKSEKSRLNLTSAHRAYKSWEVSWDLPTHWPNNKYVYKYIAKNSNICNMFTNTSNNKSRELSQALATIYCRVRFMQKMELWYGALSNLWLRAKGRFGWIFVMKNLQTSV